MNQKLPAITLDSGDKDIAKYAKLAHVNERWVRNKISDHSKAVKNGETQATKVILPRSFMSFPVKKNGKPWGVVVIDSDAEHFGSEQIKSVLTDVVYDILNKLLKGV